MTGVIYCLTSPSGKKYVGKTINYRIRMNNHYTSRLDSSKSHYPLYLAINKYGWDSFVKEKLAENIDDGDMLNILECEFIARFKQDGVTLYNATDGGEGAPGWSPDDRFRKEKGETMKRLWADPDYHAAQSKARKESWTEDRRKQASERMTSGDSPTTKLKDDQVVSIIERLEFETPENIAAEFDVHPSTIFRIKSGKTRQHLLRPNYEAGRPKTKTQIRLDRLAEQDASRRLWAGQIKTMVTSGFSYGQVASVFETDYERIVTVSLGLGYSDCAPCALEGEIKTKAALIMPDVTNSRPWKYKDQTNIKAVEHKRKIGLIKHFLSMGYRTKHLSLFGEMGMSGIGRIKSGKAYSDVLACDPTQAELDAFALIVAENPLRQSRGPQTSRPSKST